MDDEGSAGGAGERIDGASARGRRKRFRDGSASETDERIDAYWRRNLRWVAALLGIWFLVSYGFGIVLAEPLNRARIPGTGFPVGFWFAQQGAIYVFVALIFVYARVMNRLDREFGLSEE